MIPSYDTALRLFRSGEFGSLAKDFHQPQSSDSRIDLPARLLIAHALVRVGLPERARELLPPALVSAIAPRARAMAQMVLGLASRGIGNFDEALAHLQLAVRLSQEQGDLEETAWAQLHLFRHLLDAGNPQLPQAMIQTVRAAVQRAGAPQATAYLHIVVGALEGQRGRLNEGARHCAIAESVLEMAPNAWLRCSLMRNEASVALAACRLPEATSAIRMVGDLARTHSLARELVENDANLGYVELLRGDYSRSARTLSRVIESRNSSMRAKLAALESLARVHLAAGDLSNCEKCLDRVESETRHLQLHPYIARWAVLTRARLLLKSGQAERADTCLSSVEETFDEGSDLLFAATCNIASVQTLFKLRRRADAVKHLLKAERRGATRHRDVQGQFYYAASDLVDDAHPSLAHQLRDRARRLWMRQGIVSLEHEMGNGSPHRFQGKPKWDSALAINALGSVIDLAHSPQLVAQELVHIFGQLDVKARVVSEKARSGDDFVSLPVGLHRSELTLVECQIPDSPEKVVLMQDIFRIGRAAVELEQYREDEQRRTALWPEEPIEDQLGALFISEEMRELLARVRRVAATNIPVLITGETGTGKEVLARLVHAYSPRAKAPFLPFNCTAIPKDMLDSQLFGHRRGAFTGAVENFPGVVRTADRGSLLLDEIGDMPLDVQPKLLRFLESSEVHPIGESRPNRVDVRVIAATNARLETLVSQGRFREDLYYRLNIVELAIPPLRERRVDIPSLANHYLKKHAQEYSKGDLRLAEDTMEYLLLYKWPGNVRQLANEMRRIAADAETGAVLMPEHLSREIAASRRTVSATDRPADPRELVVRMDQPLPAAVEHVEQAIIQHALRKCGGRVEEAAAMLGLSRKGLYLKRRRYQLEMPAAARFQA
jgi:DNA-binding NtrC family response regulator